MTILAFAGPSLCAADRARFSGVEWRPPIEAGDLLRITPRSDLTICILDGYFDHRPAVRHKEILRLLAGGARLFGAASIGALRAAEMDTFGMIGVGAVYRAYRRGTLVGDDEVALVHAGPEWNWRPLSEPLVDVRATLCEAIRRRALPAALARPILRAAQHIHYVDRDWPAIVARCPEARPYRELIEHVRVSCKRVDAVSCLAMATSGSLRRSPRPQFDRSHFLDMLAREIGVEIEAQPAAAEPSGSGTVSR